MSHCAKQNVSNQNRVGPQTKNCDILKAWDEKKTSFELKRQCLFEIIQVRMP